MSPKYIGNAGHFQKERALSRRVNGLMMFVVGFTILMFILGWVSGYIWRARNVASYALLLLAVAVAIPWLRYITRRSNAFMRDARMDDDGAQGERLLIPALRMLPDTYTVISDFDFAESYGNIDHLVIGPNGLFAIDIKNWRGTVSADGHGELLLNGRPTDKPQVRGLTARAMNLRERLKALTRLDPYINCLMVFPHTRVEARWGTTGHVTCLRLEQVADYVTKYKPKTPLTPADQALLVKAVSALKDTITASSPKEKVIRF